MKKLIWLLLFPIVILLTGCPPNPVSCGKGQLDFEPPSFVLSTAYTSPGFLYNNGNGLAVVLDSITYQSGLHGFNHSDILNAAPHPFGTNQIIRMNNTVLSFDLKQYTRNVEFEYLDQGGTINLSAHGSANMYIGNIGAMPSTLISNGVTVTKSNVTVLTNPQGVRVAEKGVITLKFNSDIGGMTIGGQELFLDNFCFN